MSDKNKSRKVKASSKRSIASPKAIELTQEMNGTVNPSGEPAASEATSAERTDHAVDVSLAESGLPDLQHPLSVPLHYVGIGASAGGLEALRPFVANLPAKANMTYIIAQHMSPDHPSLMVELLSRETQLNVEEAVNNVTAQADTIYVAPPNSDVTLLKGKLKITPPTNTIGPKPSVDRFFMSLAEDKEDHAIGIILSGTGSDGARGIKAIKAAGGISIAQEPKSAKYDSMPNAAIRVGGTDLVLPPHEIAHQLISIVQRPRGRISPVDMDDELPSTVRGIVRQIASHAGMDFTSYKDATISRQILRRMAAMQIPTLEAYGEYIGRHRQELTELAGNFLICVTSFFRDPESFESLQRVIKDLLKSKKPGDDIRIWIPGCATGEEVYSIAIILAEELGDQRAKYKIQLFATDINPDAVLVARAGAYPESALSGMDSKLCERYFHAHEGMYHIDKSLRELILFARQDLVQDPPFVRLDMISCRNLLIYFKQDLQERVMKLFHYALKNNGILFLGRSESLGSLGHLFIEKDRKNKIYLKRPVRSPIIGGFPRMSPVTALQTREVEVQVPPPPSTEDLAQNRLFEIYIPPSLLMSTEGDIIEIFGDTSAFLSIKKGKADFNAFALIKPPFRAELRAFSHRVSRTRQSAIGSPVEIIEDGLTQYYRMAVHHIDCNEGSSPDLLLVSFETVKHRLIASGENEEKRDADKERISELEADALHNHENLQTVIEELETANEELQSLHEEAQSANEELQASNEELETANEELQASNEELITVNDELNTRTQQLSESNNDLTNVLNSLYKGVLVVDRNLTISRYNQMAHEFFEIPHDTHPNLTTIEMKVFIPNFLAEVSSVLKHGKMIAAEFQGLEGRHFIMRLLPYYNGRTEVVTGVVLTFIDITDKVESDKKVRLAASVFEHALEGMIIADTDRNIQSVNPAFERLTGYSAAEAEGKPVGLLNPADVSQDYIQALNAALESTGAWQGEMIFQHKNGDHFTAWVSTNILKEENGQGRSYITVFSDITHAKIAQDTIQRQATLDPLTGLANRNLTMDRLHQMLANCRRNMSMFAVLFMDLDHFKLINDSLGHAAGDELLYKTAQRIKEVLREADSVGRMGGDEFIVLLGNLNSIEDAIPITENILDAVRQPLHIAGHLIHAAASIGVTIYPMDGATAEILLKNADNAMYEAKKKGRNTFCFFTHHMQDEVNKRHWIDRELAAAPTNDHLSLYYQPIIRLDTMALDGAEALIRWRHPVKGFIPPDAFVPVAEQSGMICKLSLWAVETGLEDWSRCTSADTRLSLSFNLSVAQFVVRDHIEKLLKLFESSDIARRNLVTIEITESMRLSDNGEYVAILKRFRNAGCKIAIDDFGSGYSSLSYLKRMPIDIIKIDKAFVRDITTDAADAAMVRAILQMAEAFGMQTVAEGVETKEQLAFLQHHGCNFAQGYLFGEPMPFSEFRQHT